MQTLNTQKELFENDYPYPIFKFAIKTRGQYNASFVFENSAQMEEFKNTTLKELENKYGEVTSTTHELSSLKVGDSCMCDGEGDTIFKIVGIHQYEKFNWAFVLDPGWNESVDKCYLPT